MKSVVFLFAGDVSPYALERAFVGLCAAERAIGWATGVRDRAAIYVAATEQGKQRLLQSCPQAMQDASASCIVRGQWTTDTLLDALSEASGSAGADTIVYAGLDWPFIDQSLTGRLLDAHAQYDAEYTYADGWPLSLAPQVLSAKTAAMLKAVIQEKPVRDAAVCQTTLFDALRVDINSFEVETVLAPVDFRQLRLDFSAGSKRTFLACVALYAHAQKEQDWGADVLAAIASRSADVQCTVPAYCAVQITGGCLAVTPYDGYAASYRKKHGSLPVVTAGQPCQLMDFGRFCAMLDQLRDLCGDCTVCLGAFGEPLLHPQFAQFAHKVLSYPEFSLVIETDGTLVTQDLAQSVAQADPARTTWIVDIDAATEQTYLSVHEMPLKSAQEGAFSRATAAVSVLGGLFPGNVYPQMVRMKANEPELEPFYRAWHDAGSPSGGNVIIQKFDTFCGLLPDERPADLSPLVRCPCWHVKRDITVLVDGGVPLCRERCLDAACNAFDGGLDAAWDTIRAEVAAQVSGAYPELCRKCDEYYTFAF